MQLNQMKLNKMTRETAHYKKLLLSNQVTCEAIFDPYNQRVKIYGLAAVDFDEALITKLTDEQEQFTKLIVYALPGDDERWQENNFRYEGVINGFFANRIDATIWSLFLDPGRADETAVEQHNEFIKTSQHRATALPLLSDKFLCQVASPDDAPAISDVLKQIFDDYPTSLEPDYLKQAISQQASYFRCITTQDNKIVALMSAEIDHERATAEMTDCATLPDYQGQGFMRYLLQQLEQDLIEVFHIHDFYTLARADHPGINRVFGKSNYRYTGRLVNNCRMPNGWESMNIWCKII